LFEVSVRNGRITDASAVVGIGLSLDQCGDALTATGATPTTAAFTGTLTAKGQ